MCACVCVRVRVCVCVHVCVCVCVRMYENLMQGIEKGVGIVSKGIAIGTEAAGSLITKVRELIDIELSNVHVRIPCVQGANKLREKIEPNEQATEVPESVQKGVHVAKKASGNTR